MALKKTSKEEVKPVKVKKENNFTSIQILKDDRQKLFELGMEIAKINKKTAPPNPVMMVHYAVHALDAEVQFSNYLEKEKSEEFALLNEHKEENHETLTPLSFTKPERKLH